MSHNFMKHQPIYYVPPDNTYPKWLVVESDGEHWVYLSNGFLMDTTNMTTNNGGQCYLDENDFLDNSDITPVI